jgi:hypothetical protein
VGVGGGEDGETRQKKKTKTEEENHADMKGVSKKSGPFNERCAHAVRVTKSHHKQTTSLPPLIGPLTPKSAEREITAPTPV